MFWRPCRIMFGINRQCKMSGTYNSNDLYPLRGWGHCLCILQKPHYMYIKYSTCGKTQLINFSSVKAKRLIFCTKMSRLLGVCGLLFSLWAVCIDSATLPPDNIDRLEPVVRRSPDLMNSGDQFGFSVALHQVEVPQDFVSAINNTRYVAFLFLEKFN